MPTKTQTAPALAALRIETVNPAELKLADQARADATPDDALVDSVRRHGVMQLPTVTTDENGQLVILMGHRRVGAAIAAGLTEIHVIVRDDVDATERLAEQIVENERRKSLTGADLAAGYEKLTLFGLRPEDIAAQLAEKTDKIRAGITAHRSTTAREALAAGDGVDLEQAALIAEFDDDPEAQAELISVARRQPADFNRRVASHRAAREAAAKIAVLEAGAEADGIRIVDRRGYVDDYWSGAAGNWGKAILLKNLELTPAEHASCPGHAAILVGTSSASTVELRYVCTEWRDHHETPAAKEPSPEDLADRAERERQREEAAKAREAFTANTSARREWLRGFISGRLNQTAGIFDLIADATIGIANLDDIEPWAEEIAVFILTGDDSFQRWNGGARNKLTDLVVTGEIAPLRALTAHALSVCESYAGDPDTAASAPRLTLSYFDRLAGWGYPLTELDEQIRAAATATDAPMGGADDGDDEDED